MEEVGVRETSDGQRREIRLQEKDSGMKKTEEGKRRERKVERLQQHVTLHSKSKVTGIISTPKGK